MLKKLIPAVLGALLIASPALVVTTAAAQGAATPQTQSETAPAKSHHKVMKHKKASHHAWKKHSKAKKAAPQG